MKVRGFQVSPEEVEIILLQHPLIEDAGVSGVDVKNSEGLDETLPRAYVVRKRISDSGFACVIANTPPPTHHLSVPQELTEAEIQDFMSSKVISYKQLTGGAVFLNQIPRSAAGKIIRGRLGRMCTGRDNYY